MKKIVAVLFCISSLNAFAQTAKELDSIVNAFDKQNLFHGAVLVAKDGNILLNKGYGFANASQKKSNTPDLKFQIGSVTKQFTAVAILKLQEQKKLSVNDKISKYFPSFKNGSKITIYNLLTHTSGIYNYTNDTTFWLHGATSPSSHQQMMARFTSKPLDFEPGTKFSYSNSGYILLGYIIEKVSGKSYEQFIRQTIFQPLGMNESGFDFTKADNRATGYYDNGATNISSLIVDSTASYSAGAIYTTTSDLFKWVTAIHDKKILKPESWKQALTPFKQNYAFGFGVEKIGDTIILSHNGGIHGFISSLRFIPSTNSAIILLSNYMQSHIDDVSEVLGLALTGRSYELPKQRVETQLPASVLLQYVGTYQLAPTFSITITVQGNQLMAQATAQNNFPLFAEKEDFFFYKVVDAQVKFEKGNDGVVKRLILYQNGMELPGEKIK